MPFLEIDHDGLKRLRAVYRDVDTEPLFAAQLGIDRSIVNRVLRGKRRPSNQFIASVRKTFGAQWEIELFKLADE
jgi:transcriptional regulator with XRE-family HTH domain